GSAPHTPQDWRPSRRLQRIRLPRPLSLGAGEAFVRPLRGALIVLAVLVGVTTIVFTFGLREGLANYLRTATRTNGDITVSRESTVSDSGVMALLSGQPQTQQVLAIGHGPIVVAGIADPIDGVALRGDAVSLGWSTWLVRGRWLSTTPGEVLLSRAA